MKNIKIANGQGFWGDNVDAPSKLIDYGNIDYDDNDYKRNKDPTRSGDAGYTDPWKWSDDSWTSNSGKSSPGTAY